ncbi:hypothetical protein KKC17_02245 [Patescibacteria group bacterium]|nr:hypothetical protein [Patescibacteria group bacterium]
MPRYDLENRTAAFGIAVIKFVKTLPNNTVIKPIISQLIRSARKLWQEAKELNLIFNSIIIKLKNKEMLKDK